MQDLWDMLQLVQASQARPGELRSPDKLKHVPPKEARPAK